MKISEMIEQLEALKKQAGDVEVATYYGDPHDTRVSNYLIARLNDSKTDYYGFDGDGTEYDFSETNIKERLCSLKPIK